jgi:hypothetical protein
MGVFWEFCTRYIHVFIDLNEFLCSSIRIHNVSRTCSSIYRSYCVFLISRPLLPDSWTSGTISQTTLRPNMYNFSRSIPDFYEYFSVNFTWAQMAAEAEALVSRFVHCVLLDAGSPASHRLHFKIPTLLTSGRKWIRLLFLKSFSPNGGEASSNYKLLILLCNDTFLCIIFVNTYCVIFARSKNCEARETAVG